MSGAHTPGPWAVFPHYCKEDSESIYAQTWLIGLGQFDTIAEVRPGHDEFDHQNDANARLIAAAPELLAAACDGLRSMEEHLAEILSSHCLLGADLKPRRDTLDEEMRPEIEAKEQRIQQARTAIAKALGQ